MIFQQILNEESGCLSYLIGCTEAGRALVVDPGRDRVPEYLRLAAKKGLTISHILETHTHADHISGNRDLAEAVRAPILVHRAAGVAFDHQDVSDGDELLIGTVRFKIAHTPGHTPDSICLMVSDLSRGRSPRARRRMRCSEATSSLTCAIPGPTASCTSRARSTCGSRARSSPNGSPAWCRPARRSSCSRRVRPTWTGPCRRSRGSASTRSAAFSSGA